MDLTRRLRVAAPDRFDNRGMVDVGVDGRLAMRRGEEAEAVRLLEKAPGRLDEMTVTARLDQQQVERIIGAVPALDIASLEGAIHGRDRGVERRERLAGEPLRRRALGRLDFEA